MRVRGILYSMMKTITGISPLLEVFREIPSHFTLISKVMFDDLFDIRSIFVQVYNIVS
jgi:hypothetical protein